MKDLTPSSWPNDFEPHPNDLGTEIIWIKNSSSGKYEQLFVPRITRSAGDAVARGLGGTTNDWGTDAYRWVPETIATPQNLMGSSCGGKCIEDDDCVDWACRCIEGQCRRK